MVVILLVPPPITKLLLFKLLFYKKDLGRQQTFKNETDLDGSVERGRGERVVVLWVDDDLHHVVGVAFKHLEKRDDVWRSVVHKKQGTICGAKGREVASLI